MQLPGVEEVQDQLDDLGLLDADGLLGRHDFRSLVAAQDRLEMRLMKLHKKGRIMFKGAKIRQGLKKMPTH